MFRQPGVDDCQSSACDTSLEHCPCVRTGIKLSCFCFTVTMETCCDCVSEYFAFIRFSFVCLVAFYNYGLGLFPLICFDW